MLRLRVFDALPTCGIPILQTYQRSRLGKVGAAMHALPYMRVCQVLGTVGTGGGDTDS